MFAARSFVRAPLRAGLGRAVDDGVGRRAGDRRGEPGGVGQVAGDRRGARRLGARPAHERERLVAALAQHRRR